MSTKTTSDTGIKYDPTSLGVYKGLQQPVSNTLTQFMQDPLKSSFFNQRVGMGQKQISGQQAAQTQSLFSNMRGSGYGGPTTPFMQSMIARQARGNSAAQSGNFMGQLMNANQMQLSATGMAEGYNPLMTGQSSTQTKSGLGTWLPQLAGAAIGGVTSAMTGGMSSLAGGFGLGGGGFQPTDINPAPMGRGGMGTLPSSYGSTMSGFNPFTNPLMFQGMN